MAGDYGIPLHGHFRAPAGPPDRARPQDESVVVSPTEPPQIRVFLWENSVQIKYSG